MYGNKLEITPGQRKSESETKMHEGQMERTFVNTGQIGSTKEIIENAFLGNLKKRLKKSCIWIAWHRDA